MPLIPANMLVKHYVSDYCKPSLNAEDVLPNDANCMAGHRTCAIRLNSLIDEIKKQHN